MLPFLQPKKMTSVIMASRKPEGGIEMDHEEGEHSPSLMACAEDAMRAIHAKDTKGYMDAMKAAFDIMDSEPHEEGDHNEEME